MDKEQCSKSEFPFFVPILSTKHHNEDFLCNKTTSVLASSLFFHGPALGHRIKTRLPTNHIFGFFRAVKHTAGV